MPELPEVETVCQGLRPVMEGRRIVRVEQRRPDLRIPFPENFVEELEGQKVQALRRRAKYILAELQGGAVLIVHLGMSGRFTIVEKASDEGVLQKNMTAMAHPTPTSDVPGEGKHDHVVFHMEGGVRIVFSDHRRFGLMTICARQELENHALFAQMGLEPLGNELSVDYLNEKFRGKKTPIKAALLDQKIIAGLGNIYVCEALFRAGISPKRQAASIPGKRAERLLPAIQDVLRQAIEAGGSSLRDYAGADGELGYFQHQFQVYGREGEPCVTPKCPGHVKRLVQSNRSTFYCSRCQK